MDDHAADRALDKTWIRRSFDRASSTYDGSAVLQAEVRNALLQRLVLTDLAPRLVLDAGAGTAHGARALARRYPAARVVALDSSFGMLRVARKQRPWLRSFDRVCADVERLPLPDGSVDLILSNMMLLWSDLDTALSEFHRVLAPRGFLTFSTLGPDTLRELRTAWRAAASSGHVGEFIDMHDIGDALVRAGFDAPVLDVERYTLWYKDVRRLAADLKASGARNAAASRCKGLTAPRRFAAMEAAYESYRSDGRLPATYEVVFGQAWAPTAGTQRTGMLHGAGARQGAATDSAIVSVDELRRELPKHRRG